MQNPHIFILEQKAIMWAWRPLSWTKSFFFYLFRSENILCTTWSKPRPRRRWVSWRRLFRRCRWPWVSPTFAELRPRQSASTRRSNWVPPTAFLSSWSWRRPCGSTENRRVSPHSTWGFSNSGFKAMLLALLHKSIVTADYSFNYFVSLVVSNL